MTTFRRITSTQNLSAVFLIRCIVGAVFLSEGIQKFLFPSEFGVGRFVKIGIPWPEVMAPFVGCFEIVCGVLFLIGFLSRLGAIAMIVNMLVAISSTKIPMLLQKGFWSFAHESRVDFSMLLGCVFLLIVGSGSVSIDARLNRTPDAT